MDGVMDRANIVLYEFLSKPIHILLLGIKIWNIFIHNVNIPVEQGPQLLSCSPLLGCTSGGQVCASTQLYLNEQWAPALATCVNGVA